MLNDFQLLERTRYGKRNTGIFGQCHNQKPHHEIFAFAEAARGCSSCWIGFMEFIQIPRRVLSGLVSNKTKELFVLILIYLMQDANSSRKAIFVVWSIDKSTKRSTIEFQFCDIWKFWGKRGKTPPFATYGLTWNKCISYSVRQELCESCMYACMI